MLDLLMCNQRQAVLIPFRVTVAGGTPTISEGASYLTVTDNGAGDFTLTFGGNYGAASARTPIVVGLTCESDSTTNEYVANVVTANLDTTGFRVIINDDAGTASDNINFSGGVIWFGTADPR